MIGTILNDLEDYTDKVNKKIYRFFEIAQTTMFMDNDFLMLYDSFLDGVENEESFKEYFGIGNFKLSEWFNEFSGFERTIFI